MAPQSGYCFLGEYKGIQKAFMKQTWREGRIREPHIKS